MKAAQTTRSLLILTVIVLSILADRWSKMLAITWLRGEPVRDVVGTYFQFVYAENRGAFLSIGATLPDWLRIIVLALVPAVLLLGLLGYTLFHKTITRWQTVALSLVCAGGLSNLYDRITEGKVVDFMIMSIGSWRTGIFNIADISIMAGLFMMLPFYFGYPKDRA
jgi:signal peptidase II